MTDHIETAVVPVAPNDAMLRPFVDCPDDELPLAWAACLKIAVSTVAESANDTALNGVESAVRDAAKGHDRKSDPVMDSLQTGEDRSKSVCDADDAAMVRALRNAAFDASVDHTGPAVALLDLITTSGGFQGFTEMSDERQMDVLRSILASAHAAHKAMERIADIIEGGVTA